MARHEYEVLADLLRQHFGANPFTLAQAARLGVSPDQLQRATHHRTRVKRPGGAADMGLTRVAHGTYCLGTDPLAALRFRLERLSAQGIPGTVGRRTAGQVWGVAEFGARGAPPPAPPTLVVPPGSGIKRGLRGGIHIVEAELRPEDCTEVLGLPITTPLRTGLDIARVLGRDRRSALVPLCSAVRIEVARRAFPHWTPTALAAPFAGRPSAHDITREAMTVDLRAQLQREFLDVLERAPTHGTSWIRRVMDDIEPLLETPAEVIAWSDMTSSRRLPRPVPQMVVKGASGRSYRADFVLLGRVILEVDGAVKYSETTPWDEKVRQSDLEAAGYWIVRCTWAELIHHPERVLERLLIALQRAAT